MAIHDIMSYLAKKTLLSFLFFFLLNRRWLTSCPNENINLTLYILRILMRDTYFQKYFIDNSNTKPIFSLIYVKKKIIYINIT